MRQPILAFTVLAVASIQLSAEGQEIADSAEATGISVGAWGDPDRIQFEGVRHFDARQIRHGLAGSLNHFMASHPSAPLAKFLESLQQHVLAGYRHAGFGEAAVEARLDRESERIHVHVNEGRRWTAGGLRVEGPSTIRKPLSELLVKPHTPEGATAAKLSDSGGVLEWADADGNKVDEQKPVWMAGEPAKFDLPATQARRKRIQECLADLGYDQAVVSSKVTRGDKAAEWLVRVEDLGPPAILKTIKIEGNQVNTREGILAFLALQPDAKVTKEMRRQIERSIWSSARFVSCNVDVERLPDNSGVTLTINVKEYKNAPALSAAFSREEAALIKHRSWMVDGPGREMDLVITAEGAKGSLESIVSPVTGVSACWWKTSDMNGAPDFAMAATTDQLTAYALGARRFLSASPSSAQLNAQLTIGITEDPEHPFRVAFGLSVKTLADHQRLTPFSLTTSTPPVCFLAQAHEDAVCTWDGPVLTIKSKHGTLRIHEESGELIDFEFPSSRDDDWRFDYSLRRDAFNSRRRQLAAASNRIRNEFDRGRPVSSTVAFFLESGMLTALGDFLYGEGFTKSAPQESLAVLGKLVDRKLLAVADTVATDWLGASSEAFEIPWTADADRPFETTQYYGFLVALVADRVFPRNCWAWTLWRESALGVAGLSQHTGSELHKLLNDQRSGPTSYWLIAELLRSIHRPEAQPVAQYGLRKLDQQAFVREWEAVLGADLPTPLEKTLAALRSLSDEDAAKLMKMVGEPDSDWARAAGQFRAAIATRSTLRTADLLEVVWATVLRDPLKQRLSHLGEAVPIADKPNNAVNRNRK